MSTHEYTVHKLRGEMRVVGDDGVEKVLQLEFPGTASMRIVYEEQDFDPRRTFSVSEPIVHVELKVYREEGGTIYVLKRDND